MDSDLKKIVDDHFKIYTCIGAIRYGYFQDELVYFRRAGFNHLIRKGSGTRSQEETLEHVSLLPYCPEILNAGIMTEHRVSVRSNTAVNFWAFTAKAVKGEARLIVRQIGKGQKQFFSVFPVTQKRP